MFSVLISVIAHLKMADKYIFRGLYPPCCVQEMYGVVDVKPFKTSNRHGTELWGKKKNPWGVGGLVQGGGADELESKMSDLSISREEADVCAVHTGRFVNQVLAPKNVIHSSEIKPHDPRSSLKRQALAPKCETHSQWQHHCKRTLGGWV